MNIPQRCYKTLQSLLKMWDVNIFEILRFFLRFLRFWDFKSANSRTGNVSIYLFITVILNITTEVWLQHTSINTEMLRNYHMQTSLIQYIKYIWENLFVITNFIYLLHCAPKWLKKQFRKWSIRKVATLIISIHLCGEALESVFFCWLLHIQGSKVVAVLVWMQCLSKLFSLDTGFCKGLRGQIQNQIKIPITMSNLYVPVPSETHQNPEVSGIFFFICSQGANLQVSDCKSRTCYVFIEQSPENFRLWWFSVYWQDELFILHYAGKPKCIL